MWLRRSLLGTSALSLFFAAADAREWTDSTGRHKSEAEFIELKDGIVKVRTPNGTIKSVRLEKLSTADQEYARRSERFSQQINVNKYIRYALDLSTKPDKNKANYALVNARMFGIRSSEIDEALDKCPNTALEHGVPMVDAEGEVVPEGQVVPRFGQAIDVAVEDIAARISISDKWDQIESSMLMDDALLGDAMCVAFNVNNVNGLLFLRTNRLSLKSIINLYGEPASQFSTPQGTKVLYYGRFAVFQPTDDKPPFLCRFNGPPAAEKVVRTVSPPAETNDRSRIAKATLPHFNKALSGTHEVRVVNPNNFLVTVGVRSGDSGKDFEVKANGSKESIFVPNGSYDIYFVYSDHPDDLYQGDSFSINGNGIQITITKVVNGNYGIRKVN